MDTTKAKAEIEKRQKLREILTALANSQLTVDTQEKRDGIYDILEQIYHIPGKAEHFRHFYSDIFAVVSEVFQEDTPGDITALVEKLEILRKEYHAKNVDSYGELIDINDSIRKLYDHVNLDMARLAYSKALLEQKADAARLQSQIADVSNKAEIINEKVEQTQEKGKNMQKEYIAILGIFASVVLALTAAFAFSTSVLENMHQSSIYRIIIIASVIGLVFVNLIYALFYYIDRIVHGKNKASIKPLFVVNAVFLVLIIAAIIAWGCGLVEFRNAHIFR